MEKYQSTESIEQYKKGLNNFLRSHSKHYSSGVGSVNYKQMKLKSTAKHAAVKMTGFSKRIQLYCPVVIQLFDFRIYALKRVEEKLAQASAKHLAPNDKILLWTEAQLISSKYGFKTHVMTAELAADVKIGIKESLSIANENYEKGCMTLLGNQLKN